MDLNECIAAYRQDGLSKAETIRDVTIAYELTFSRLSRPHPSGRRGSTGCLFRRSEVGGVNHQIGGYCAKSLRFTRATRPLVSLR